MTTRSDLEAGIAPGSLPHGSRQDLVAGLQAAVPGDAGAAPSGAPNTQPSGAQIPGDSFDDPLAALLGGQIDPGGGDQPLTTGLSVGPGAGPAGAIEQQDPVKVRLQLVATSAASPLVRAAARSELRRLTGESL